ncbi:flagellar type III secretion system pore protein FliP [Thermosulfidibacter takaii]|uniref:flagellar type III secretion system pore protein FliP n=1 Tax=Thermosulfidibacter takaii TaxID=412593 RepID=UPI000838EB5A|nr:flagellar type III secretion system pore protein FliP [Thermosulfidibacter takaii]
MKKIFKVLLLLLVIVLVDKISFAVVPVPKLTIGVEGAKGPNDVAVTLEIIFLITIIALAPSILIMLTSFTRIVVVLSLLRSALGTQQMPPNQVLIGLALFLTFFVMAPTWSDVYHGAISPYMEGKLSFEEAYNRALVPLRKFMFSQVREKDLAVFCRIAKIKPKNEDDVPTHVLIPAFITSELQTAFEIGFMIYIPFLIIDIVISSILLSMGMIMLPPVLISLPFKLLLFVLVNGWDLVVVSLVRSFRI